MKKLFALLLVFAMLVPMALTVNAEGEVTAEPFYVLNCSNVDNQKYPYVEEYVNTRFGVLGDKVTLSYGGASLMYGSYTDEDVTKFAQVIKKEMDARPAGLRYMHLWGPGKALSLAPQNRIYLDFGVDQMKQLVTDILKKYKEIGGQLSGLILDVEYTDLGSWYIQGDAAKDPLVYKKIVTDPRYATEVRPLLEERGFKFYHNPTDLTPEIYCISKETGNNYAISRTVWDTVMRIRLMKYIEEWCYTPLKEYFPNATVSDYQSTDTYAWLKGVNDAGEVVGAVAGNPSKAGNVSNYNFYASRPGTNFYQNSSTKEKVFTNPPTYNQAVYDATAFNMFLYDANLAKRMYASTDTKMISAWLARYDYSPNREDTLSNTPYYAEQIFHLGLMDPEPFLGYLYDQEFLDENKKVSKAVYESRISVLNELMAELTRVAGYSDRKPIELPMNWNSEFVLSGMYTGGRNLWRITPNTELVSTKDFKIEGTDPTFRVAGQTVTFPGGKIVEDGKISVVGTCGYWVETAKDVTPVITNDADRFEKIPAYLEDFESYKLGTQLTTPIMQDEGGWIIQQPKDSLITVVADGKHPQVSMTGDNQLISMTGDALMRNKLIPANVTAADSYAMEQIWELTVIVPGEMGGQFVFLDYAMDKQTTADGGYKIEGGKVYYSENGQYKELALDVTGGSKYIFKRVLNFNANTCDYIVTDAEGKEVASAKGVAIPAYTGKVSDIGITCKKVTGKVFVDDYTLRVTGTAADFGVYDFKTGLRLDASKAHAASTAYRFSWMNASGAEQTAAVVAEFYEGETLKETKTLKELKLAPGCDGVETGVLEVAEGQSVKVYVKTDVKVNVELPVGVTPEPTTPNATEPTTAPTESTPTEAPAAEKGGSNPLVIILIAVVAVAVVAIVLVLVLTKKKPAKTEE